MVSERMQDGGTSALSGPVMICVYAHTCTHVHTINECNENLNKSNQYWLGVATVKVWAWLTISCVTRLSSTYSLGCSEQLDLGNHTFSAQDLEEDTVALKRGQSNSYLGIGHRDACPAVAVNPSCQGPCNVLSATPHPGLS